jgi:hypothetical protein
MRRLVVFLIVFVACLSFTARADALPFVPDPCDLAPGGVVQDACKVVTDPVGSGVGIVGGAVGGTVNDVTAGVAGSIFDQAMSWFSAMLADTVKSAMDGLGSALSSAPAPPIDTAWFAQEYRPLVAVGIGLCWLMFLIHLVWNWVRFRTAEIWRCFLNCLLAMFLVATGPLFIKMAVEFADALTAAFAAWGGPQAQQLTDNLSQITGSITETGGLDGVKPLLLILVLMVAVVLVIFWMILLVIRTLIIYLGTLAIPFVLPSIIDGKARFARFYFRALFGVIISAPILFGTVVAGAWLLKQGAVDQHGIWAIMGGIGIMALAILLPATVLKFLLPMAAPVIVAIERGGHRVVDSVKDVRTKVAAGAAAGVTGGASLALMADGGGSKPRTPPPRPRGDPT